MTKKELKRKAHTIAWRMLDRAKGDLDLLDACNGYEEDAKRLSAELDELAQRHFVKSEDSRNNE